jgi:hypothetical protein
LEKRGAFFALPARKLVSWQAARWYQLLFAARSASSCSICSKTILMRSFKACRSAAGLPALIALMNALFRGIRW